MRKVISIFVVCMLLFLINGNFAHAKNFNNKRTTTSSATNKDNPKYASLVMDADTGRILSKRYADKTLHPASLTKIMTLLLVFEALDRGEIQKGTRMKISSHAANMVPSKLGLKVGSRIRVEDAIKALATKSANDVAVAIAEHLGGSESRFAVAMTARARTIGMKSTRFKNASGLHHKSQVTTARDMAKLARYILKRYPHYYKYFSTRNFTYQGKTYKNHNKLLQTYAGMDGFKTGYINASGFNLVASSHRNGRRLIGVVFGGRSGKTRNAHMANIMDAGFRRLKNSRTARLEVPPKPSVKPTYGVARVAVPKQDPVAFTAAVPTRKPDIKSSTDYASLSSLGAKKTTKITTRIDDQNANSYLGEGDVDPSLALPHPKDVVGKWSVQIGAYKSRLKTDDALRAAKVKLPSTLQKVTVMTVPLDTEKGMVFRARLGGMTEAEARQACGYFKDCIPVAPIATRVSAHR